MDKIEAFLINNKKDISCVLILLFLFIATSICVGKIYGDLFIDCGRESYLPQIMLQGKVLIKDIFAMYNPLSYQINSILYLIFGKSFNVLYMASYINAFFILVGLYFICRFFINEFYSLTFCITIMSLFVFSNNLIISYIFPYSFAIIYATCAFVYSLILFLKYIETNNKNTLYFSFLLLGISFANKPEYLLCIIPMIIALAYKKESLKVYILSILTYVIPTFLSYGILFVQGLKLVDLLNYFHFYKNFFLSPEQIYYSTNLISPPWTIETIKTILKTFENFVFFIIIGCFYFSLFRKNLLIRICGLLLLPAYIAWNFDFADTNSYNNLFCWVILALFVILYLKMDKFTNLKEQMFVFVAFSGILSTARINFLPIIKYNYSIYFVIPILAVWVYFFSTDFKEFEKYKFKLYIACTLILFSFINIVNLRNYYMPKSVLFRHNKGCIQSNREISLMYKNLVNWVENNTDVNDSILMLPEGIMLNFLTERPTKLKYYHLMPNHIKAMGEDKIVEGLNKDRPNYIIINNLDYGMFGTSFMCEDFGKEICKFTEKNYNHVKTFDYKIWGSKHLTATIYKEKKHAKN